jgi:hypothetical protein
MECQNVILTVSKKNEKYHSHTRQWADIQSFQRFWGMGELSIHRWKGFELYPVINKKTVSSKIALRLAYQHTLSVVATPMSQPLFHLAFPVGDIPQTKAFYVAGLGFDILPCLKAEDSCSWFHERTYFIRFPF